MPDAAPGSVAIARVLGAWGADGAVKAEPLAPPAVLKRGRPVTVAGQAAVIEQARPAGRYVHIKLSGVDSREAAAALLGAYVEAPEDDLPPLPEGQFYRFQLLGMRVAATDGRDLGEVQDILSTQANDVYVVRGPLGEVLVPAIDDVVREIDLASRTMTVERSQPSFRWSTPRRTAFGSARPSARAPRH